MTAQRSPTVCTNNRGKAENDVSHILTSEDKENTPHGSRMWFRMNFMSDVFSSKTLLSI